MSPRRTRQLVAASVVTMVIAWAAASPARASHDERWYGWQMLPSDLAAWALIGGGALTTGGGRAALQYLGVIAATLGGPIVHFANGRGAVGLGSLGLRGGALVAAAVSLAFSEDPHDPGGRRAAKSAVVVGAAALITAQLVDLVVIARQRRGDDDAPGQRMLRLGFAF